MHPGPGQAVTDIDAPAPSRPTARTVLLLVSFGLLLLVGLARESAALPDLGPRGWAPGTLLPVTLRSAPVSVVLATAYVLGAAAVVLGWLRGRVLAWTWPMAFALGGLALLTRPFGSADHTSYAGYGRLAALGVDPYVVPPNAWVAAGGVDPVIAGVEPPHHDVVSIYGPVATMIMALTGWLGGDNQRQVVWLWQLVVVASWLAIRAVLVRLSDDPARVDLLWTANPLVFGIGVLGAHADMLAGAFCLLALLAAARDGRWALAAGVAAGLATGVKLTAALIVPAILIGWWVAQRREVWTRTALFALGLAPGLALYALWWPDILTQLRLARRHVSFASPWRLLLDSERLGPVDDEGTRALIVLAAAVVCIALAVVLWALTRAVFPATTAGVAGRVLVVGSLAYILTAPYSLPWYDVLLWAGLALGVRSAIDLVAVWRGTVLAIAYVPGRVVAMSEEVAEITLAIRRDVAPYGVLIAWLAVAALLAVSLLRSRRRPGPPSPSGPPLPPDPPQVARPPRSAAPPAAPRR